MNFRICFFYYTLISNNFTQCVLVTVTTPHPLAQVLNMELAFIQTDVGAGESWVGKSNATPAEEWFPAPRLMVCLSLVTLYFPLQFILSP